MGISIFKLGGDRKTASVTEGFVRNLKTWRGLLALVFRAIDHADDALHHFDVESAIGRDALCGWESST